MTSPLRRPDASERAVWRRAERVAIALVGLLLLAGSAGRLLFPAGQPLPSEAMSVPAASDEDGAGPPAAAVVPAAATPAAVHAATPERLDLNRADVAMLRQLPGIGAVLADRILAFREARGGFTSTDELRQVAGIGPKRFERLAPLVRVGDGP